MNFLISKINHYLIKFQIKFYGAMGYSDEVLISRAFRDMRLLSIAGIKVK